ncbi:MAG TPA: hypothetical protein VG984_03510 [Candidatus Paceibacterota bacterium]|nr:hypothetical protein [Candidatus Paceibacterota bacterium]
MKNIIKITIVAGVLILLGVAGLVFFFSRTTPTSTSRTIGGFFGISQNVSTTQPDSGETNGALNGNPTAQKVFKIADGPIAGAVFYQTGNPTTTIARYVVATNGHILDQPIDVPGAAARPASNTTIPGIVSAAWGRQATSTILQYVDSGVVKSVSFTFTATTSTVFVPPRIQFLPNNILSLAISPDSRSVAYLIATNGGSDGYIADVSGANPKKLFSVPFSQVLISWPTQSTLLVETKSAVGVPGVAFSVNSKTGVLVPMLYADGLSAIANSTFSKILYQTTANSEIKTYAHDTATGKDTSLVNNPILEKCAWSTVTNVVLYCAVSLDVTQNPDLWHQGLLSSQDSIVQYDSNGGGGSVVTLPGNGGMSGAIEQIGVSPDGAYLWFITRGDQSLWGVRLF